MVLVLTNSGDATADHLIPVLDRSGIPLVRLDTDTLVDRCSLSLTRESFTLELEEHRLTPADFDHVWYRRPEVLKSARFDDSPESKYALNEWAEGLEGFLSHIPASNWMNHPRCNSHASQKLLQLSVARSLGFLVPDSLVTQDEQSVRGFFRKHDERIIVKPMARGYIKRGDNGTDMLIYTNRVQEADLHILDDLRSCPSFFQEYIDKESDVRITLVDDQCSAVALRASDPAGRQRCDIRRNNMADVEYRPIALPESVRTSIRGLMNHYDLRFGAIDMVISKDGIWYFLEINPNGQWAWLDEVGAASIASFFVSSFSGCPDESRVVDKNAK